ncbi:MAG: RagB/SusD family nutrient uptake outer membrane protein, partial [Bacteroidota bacterium]|nr:RagB/SusD family nutrient uptake outer membrane protein [Bacteroidota bacterium]
MKKRYSIIFLCTGLMMFFLTSCLDSYLDKAPEAGLSEDDVFSKYENFKLFFDAVYKGQNSSKQNVNIQTAFPLYFSFWDQKYPLEALTDMSDEGRLMDSQTIKGGQMGTLVNKMTTDGARRPIELSMFTIIRICNMTLEKINQLKNATEQDKADFIAQAYFCRGFAHFTLFKFWGRMPYITKVLGPNDQWDIPRLSNHETLMKIAADMDSAFFYFEKAGMMRRDNPAVGGAGHLNNDNLFRPNGVTALAMKGRVLLYAASPLNNELGKTDWENAAKANWVALDSALSWGYFMYPQADYKLNYINTRYSDEEIWGWSAENKNYNNGDLCGLQNGVFAANTGSFSGENPTQNTVDKFETKWGDPLNTDADRQAAIALGHYSEQNPYANRDPRFYV